MRKLDVLILLFVVAVAASVATFDSPNEPCSEWLRTTPHVVILTATDTEQNAVFEEGKVESTCSFENIFYTVITFKDTRMIVVKTGVGPKLATEVANKTFENFNVKTAIFSGTAGLLDDSSGFKIGDTIVAQQWYLDGYDPNRVVEVNESLRLLAFSVSMKSHQNVTFVDSGVTTVAFVEDMFVKDQLGLTYGATIVDMETFVVAEQAAMYYVPFIAFRSISDVAEGFSTEENFELAARNSAKIALDFALIVGEH